MVSFTHVCFSVLDMEKAVKFYDEHLGLKAIREFNVPDGSAHLVYLNDGNSDFTLELAEKAGRTEPFDVGENAYHLAFLVPEAEYDEMHKKHSAQGMIIRETKELALYFIQDPDGNEIEIMREPGIL